MPQVLMSLLLVACAALPQAGAAIDPDAMAVRLPLAGGGSLALADLADADATVVVFLGTECPLVKLYAPRLEGLSREYRERGVRFVGIASNHQDSIEEILEFGRQAGLSFPIAKDADQKVADAFGAKRTPEAFVLDNQCRVRYQGRIDDQYGIDVVRPKPTRRDLVEATEEVLANSPVSQPCASAVGCLIGRAPKQESQASVTYSNQIARIFQKRCVECHRPGEIGPFPMMTYADIAGWGEMILEVVEQKRMPPWFADPAHGRFANDPRLSEEEIELVRAWVDAGSPEGDPSQLPSPPSFVEGWNIPKPDLVLPMSRPFQVPAEGVIDYQHYVIDPGFTEDKWVVASEARPGNRAVVHHILVFLAVPGQPVELVKGSLLAAYAPGMPPRMLQPGMAKRIPAGSRIILQMHYTPNGQPQTDISSVGLVFCEEKDVEQRVDSGWAFNPLMAIPPRKDDHPIFARYVFTEDKILFNLTPHMHMRGKTFRFEAWYPDGRQEVLLNLPRWNFNWQLEYEFAEPKLMPKGTELRCYATYDNSPSNPSNPDPNRWVKFGEQTWDEMMIGWFTAATVPGAPIRPQEEVAVTGGQEQSENLRRMVRQLRGSPSRSTRD